MISGIDVPLEVAVVLGLAGLVAGRWVGRRQANMRLDPRRNALAESMTPATLLQAIDLTARRNARRSASHAMLHGRIDQMAGLCDAWDPETREQVQGHVAAVMRAGLRRGDSFAISGGDGFIITIPGADERTAARIADRLRRSLALLRLPHRGGNGRVTASFGVAAEQFGDTGDTLVRRAHRALNAARAQGKNHVITASEIEEIMLLPAPAANTPTVSAA